MGSDAIKKGSRGGEETPKLEDKKVCIEAYNELTERANSFGGEGYEEDATEGVVENNSGTTNEERESEVPTVIEGGDIYENPSDKLKFEELLDGVLELTLATSSDSGSIRYTDLNSDDLNVVIDLIISEGIKEVPLAYYQTSNGKRITLSVERGSLYNGSSMVKKQ